MIGEAVAAALPLMRAHAESLMSDTCKVDRQSGPPAWDEEAQASVPTWEAVHAAMPCHFDRATASARQLVTDEAVTPVLPLVKGPVSFVGIKPDDRITVTAVGPVSDPEHLGAVVWVTDVVSDTHPVERLIQCRWTR